MHTQKHTTSSGGADNNGLGVNNIGNSGNFSEYPPWQADKLWEKKREQFKKR